MRLWVLKMTTTVLNTLTKIVFSGQSDRDKEEAYRQWFSHTIIQGTLLAMTSMCSTVLCVMKVHKYRKDCNKERAYLPLSEIN
jgi:hypothetical protein